MMFGSSILKCAVQLLAVAVICLSASPGQAQPCARWEVSIPNPRDGFGAAYDSTRGRTLLFGGRVEEGIVTFSYERDTWSWDGARWARLSESGPSPRWAVGMAYDRVRDRVVLFGGADSTTFFADTWEWDGQAWSIRAVAGPGPRRGHIMAYDEARGRTVLFGGDDASGRLGDTWEWDGRAWIKLSVEGPSPRTFAGATYHAGLGEVMIFGGALPGTARSDEFWAWNGERWRKIEGAGPPARYSAGLSYQRNRGRVVLIGGVVQGGSSVRTWEWDGGVWLDTGITGPLMPRGVFVFDESRGVSHCFKGSFTGNPIFEVDAWDGSKWIRDLSMCGPRQRRDHSMVFDTVRGQPLVAGGISYQLAEFDDTWVRGTDDSWIKLPVVGPGGVDRMAMTYDSARLVAVLFGGDIGMSYDSDTWEWDGAAWSLRTTALPPARVSHAMAYDSVRGVSVMFGGDCSGPDDSSTWEWNGTAWSEHATPEIPIRFEHAMAYDPLRRITTLFGGSGRFGASRGDLWEWDGMTWTELDAPGPSPRSGHAMAYVPALGAIVLFGGRVEPFGPGQSFDDTWMWDGKTWTQLDVTGPLPRSDHAMAFDSGKQRLLLVGGSPDTSSALSDIGDTWELAVYDTLSITRGPVPATAVSARPVSFTAEVSGGGTIAYQWKKDGVALIDDGRIVGSGTSTLTIIAAQRGDAGNYTLEVTNACGHDESGPALLTITCRADLDGDGTVDFADYLAFLSDFDAQDPEADLTLDGIVDFADYLEFLNAYEEGC